MSVGLLMLPHTVPHIGALIAETYLLTALEAESKIRVGSS